MSGPQRTPPAPSQPFWTACATLRVRLRSQVRMGQMHTIVFGSILYANALMRVNIVMFFDRDLAWRHGKDMCFEPFGSKDSSIRKPRTISAEDLLVQGKVVLGVKTHSHEVLGLRAGINQCSDVRSSHLAACEIEMRRHRLEARICFCYESRWFIHHADHKENLDVVAHVTHLRFKSNPSNDCLEEPWEFVYGRLKFSREVEETRTMSYINFLI